MIKRHIDTGNIVTCVETDPNHIRKSAT